MYPYCNLEILCSRVVPIILLVRVYCLLTFDLYIEILSAVFIFVRPSRINYIPVMVIVMETST